MRSSLVHALSGLILVCGCLTAFCGGMAECPIATNAVVESTCVPLNYRMWRAALPNGERQDFLQDDDNPLILHGIGERTWVGVRRPDDGLINILTRPGVKKTPKVELGYLQGYLRFMDCCGRQYEFAKPTVPTNSLSSFWKEKRCPADQTKVGIWRDSSRLTFLSSNPNRSAILFVQLALIALGVLLVAHGWKRHVSILCLCGALILLFLTGSRGGGVAFALGAMAEVLVVFRARLRWKWVVCCGLVMVLAVVGAMVALQRHLVC